MRIHVDLKSHVLGEPALVQVQKTPEIGNATPINGKYILPTPDGVDFPVTSGDYVLDGSGHVDGSDLASKGFAQLLAKYPQYGNVYFNPLLTDDHVGELVLDQSVAFVDRTQDPPVSFYSRLQTGRESGGSDSGQMPTHTALLPQNDSVDPARPGLLMTDLIDIGPYTLDCGDNPVGASEFMVYWKLLGFSVTEDVAADVGALAGTNEPAVRSVVEVDQEPDGFTAYLSTDDGANWCEVGLMEPVSFCDKSTQVRLAFKNTSSSKVYLASYALMF